MIRQLDLALKIGAKLPSSMDIIWAEKNRYNETTE